MYQKILVPLDGSAFGEHALPLALALARRTKAAVSLVHVHSPQSLVYLEGAGLLAPSVDAHLRQQEQAYLDKMVDRVAGVAPGVAVTVGVLDGDVADTIARHASAEGFDLVVMTTHGRGAFGRFWLGSMADVLVRKLPMPLLLVRPREDDSDLKAEPTLKSILLPLDGSPLGEGMVDPVMNLAATLKARVTLLRVIQPVPPVSYVSEAQPIDQEAWALLDRMEELQKALKLEATDYLNTVARRLQNHGIPVDIRVSVERQAAVAILHEATAAKCDLIALETHGRRGLSRLILGSVADKVIRGASVPVLVHRPLNP